MHLNPDWIYRKVHIFHILINMRNNRILSISPALSSLFESDRDIDSNLNLMSASLSEEHKISLMRSIAYLKQAGVLIDA